RADTLSARTRAARRQRRGARLLPGGTVMPDPDIPSYLPHDELGPWQTYLEQVERVAPWIDRDLSQYIDTLSRPKRVLIVDVPIKLDDGTVEHYEGYRVQHNVS